MKFTPAPTWACERAVALANQWGTGNWTVDGSRATNGNNNPMWPSMAAFAIYISEHEEPPVDEKLLKAREILSKEYDDTGWKNTADQVRKGLWDGGVAMKAVLKALS